jgi:hypothetical protein
MNSVPWTMTWLAIVALGAAAAAAPEAPPLADATAKAAIAFRHRAGSPEKDWIAEVNGSGVALFDYDGDGDLDIYFVTGSVFDAAPGEPPPRNALYRNDGAWRFTDVTGESGAGETGWGSAAAAADFDNDGWLDLYLAKMGPNVLLRNRGDGTFARVEAGGAEDPRWSASASCADFDRDGRVDIYVANYVVFDRTRVKPRSSGACVYKGAPIFCGPGGLEAAPDSLFVNLGGLRFRDASAEWGVREVEASYGLGTLVADIQRDGWPDVVVANDTRANFCFLNEGGRRFREAGLFLGLAYNDFGVAQAGMGLASGDTRGLGRDDVFVTNFEDDVNTLYLAGPDRLLYTDSTYAAGLGTPSYPYLGWGAFFFDADGDGDLDLFVANGHVAPQMDGVRPSKGYRQRNQLFLNDGKGKYREVMPDACPALAILESSRGAACGDLDADGDPDIVVSNIDAPPTLLENRAASRDWLEVRLRGTRSNRAAIGARVTAFSGGRAQERTIQSGMSYASQCELAARFGIGKVDRIRVVWPSGLVEEFAGPAEERGPRRMLLTEGEGRREGL